jgi:hypothetical protein
MKAGNSGREKAAAIPVGLLFAVGFLKPFLLIHSELTVSQRVISSVCFIVGGLFAGLIVAMAFLSLIDDSTSKTSTRIRPAKVHC